MTQVTRPIQSDSSAQFDYPELTSSIKISHFIQETRALTKRLFIQLIRRPSTLIAGLYGARIFLELCIFIDGDRHYCWFLRRRNDLSPD